MFSEGVSSKSVCRFFRGLRDIYTILDHQVSKNIIYISTKKNDNIKNTNSVIIQTTKKVTENVESYDKAIESYNIMGEKYFKKAEYF